MRELSTIPLPSKFFSLSPAAIILVYSVLSYTFPETYGVVESNISVQKQSGSPPTEVDIPLIIMITNGTATAGEGIQNERIIWGGGGSNKQIE